MKNVISVLITKTLVTGFVISSIFAANSAQALNSALQDFTGGTSFPSFNGTNQTIGWSFIANDNLSVTALGFYDPTPGTDLSQSHLVGLWASDGSLLASTTVETNSVLTGSFRYENITSVNLLAGNSYVIGAAITSPFSDNYISSTTSVSTAPEITFTDKAVNGSSQGFSFPSTLTAGGNGRIGPNFQFITVAVPFEFSPTEGILLGVPLFIGLRIVKRKRAMKKLAVEQVS